MASVQTANQLFPHDCGLEDLRFSAYTPRSVSFYCIQCGGTVSIRAERSEWSDLFGADSLALTEKALHRIIDPEEDAAEVAARRARNRPAPVDDED